MDFGLNETQRLIRSTASELLAVESSPSYVREMAEDERGFTGSFWQEIAGLGWLGLIVPEEHGGSGMSMIDVSALLAEWGAALAPGPLVESAVVSAAVIRQFGDASQKQAWLGAIAEGDLIAVPALPNATDVKASEISDGWVLTGQIRYLAYANSAELVLLPVETSAGLTMFALPLALAEGTVGIENVKMASGSHFGNVELNEVLVPNSSVMGDAGNGDGVLATMMLYGATARALQMVGAGNAVVERTVDYVKNRRQFGRPIGAFQVIQHYMADITTKVKSAKHMADRAAWALTVDPSGNSSEIATSRIVSQAKWATNKLMNEVIWTAHQSHGAIGFTWEHDLHLYTRRILSWRAEYGDADAHLDNLAASLSAS